jgi:AraC family transcriptional regulator of adaptative response/methylated-DNA-[protein]-cysteine methyltransferase
VHPRVLYRSQNKRVAAQWFSFRVFLLTLCPDAIKSTNTRTVFSATCALLFSRQDPNSHLNLLPRIVRPLFSYSCNYKLCPLGLVYASRYTICGVRDGNRENLRDGWNEDMKAGLAVSNNAAWTAVLRRDRHYDGRFVYVAVTTGIYCRSSCPARSPRRRNALIFRSAVEAEERGYAACLRCQPRSSLTSAESCIRSALDYIEGHLEQPITLRTLSQVSGLSPHHFRETFQRIVGLSPKAFCDARRIAGFKQLLRAGESISGACYQVGFGSSRALYEKTYQGLGMTPANYRRGGAGVGIRYAICSWPYGFVLIARTGRGVCAVLFDRDERALVAKLKSEFPRACLKQEPRFERRSALRAVPDEDPLMLKLPTSLRERILQARLAGTLQ